MNGVKKKRRQFGFMNTYIVEPNKIIICKTADANIHLLCWFFFFFKKNGTVKKREERYSIKYFAGVSRS